MQLQFFGAARGVTGSRHLLTVNGRRVLLDCGLFQGRREESNRLNRHMGFDAADVDAVVLSHAHIDHSGALPALVAGGFRGRIHATRATVDLLGSMLRDSAMIQEKDAEFLNKRRNHRRNGRAEPLYTMEDTEATLLRLQEHAYHKPVAVVSGVEAVFYDAGHILGSSVVQLTLTEGSRRRILVFSGDLGRRRLPIIRDPETPPEADALIIESTYGDRLHKPVEEADEHLAALIGRVCGRGGKLLIPAFAVGRTQELTYAIARLLRAGRVPGCGVYVDSPLAVNVTEIFARHQETFDEEIRAVLRETGDPFGFELIEYVRDVEESKALNAKKGPFIVISASGMMETGRILHHARNSVGDPRNMILFVGYQAEHTLGRRIRDGEKEVRIFGEPHEVRAEVAVMDEFSAHADRDDLLAWVRAFKRGPHRAFVVHGEEDQSLPFADRLRAEAGIRDVLVPRLRETGKVAD